MTVWLCALKLADKQEEMTLETSPLKDEQEKDGWEMKKSLQTDIAIILGQFVWNVALKSHLH